MIVTLLSDRGTNDAGIAAAKVRIMQRFAGAVVVDITHDAAVYDVHQAAYVLRSAYPHFKKGTVHVVAADIASEGITRIILAVHDGFYFIAPDNGVLPLALGTAIGDTRICFEPHSPVDFAGFMEQAVAIITAISANDISSYQFTAIKEAPGILRAHAFSHSLDCSIRYIDRYGNVVLDITRAQFDEVARGRPFRIPVMKERKDNLAFAHPAHSGFAKARLGQQVDVTAISENYGDVAEGEPLCRFNNAGFLEIAINHDSAAGLLKIRTGNSGSLLYKTIRIFF